MDNVEVMVYKTLQEAQAAATLRNRLAKGNRHHTAVPTSSGFLLQRTRMSGRVDRYLKSNIWMKVKA